MSAASNSSIWRSPLYALLLPALLIGLGVWQITRADETSSLTRLRVERLQASEDKVRAIAKSEPNAALRFSGSAQSYTPAEALRLMEEDRSSLGTDRLVERAREGSAWMAAGGGGVALLAALIALALVRMRARSGLKNRESLVRGFGSVVRRLPFLLGCVAVGTGLGVVGAVLFEVGGSYYLNSINTGEIKLMLLAVVVAGGSLVYAFNAVRQLRRALGAYEPKPLVTLGRTVAPAEAPGLFAFLRDIAEKQGASVPDNVVLGLTEGFFVTSSPVRLMPEDRALSGHSLYLPATYLPLLSREQTAAIVAHEMAHFTGEDTRYTQDFLPLYASMSRSMDAVMMKGSKTKFDTFLQPASLLARYGLTAFDHAVNHWSRLREFEADRASLRVGENRDAATALIRTGVSAGIIDGALRDAYEHPNRASNDLVGDIMARAGSVGFTEPGRYLDDRQAHPTDTHPLTRQRIEALGVKVDDNLLAEACRPVPEGDGFVESLFDDWTGLRRRLGDDLLGDARQQDQRYQAALETAASAVSKDVEFHENAGVQLFAIGFLVCVFAGLAGVAIWLTLSGFIGSADDLVWGQGLAVALLAIGGLLAWFMLKRYRRARGGPFLVIGPEGCRIPTFAGIIPWSAITAIGVTTGQKFFTTFSLDPKATLPERDGKRWSVKLDRRKNLLTLVGYVPKGMKPQAYLDLLIQGRQACHAREALRARQAQMTGVPETPERVAS